MRVLRETSAGDLMVIAFGLIVIVGLVVVWAAFGGPPKGED